MSQDEQGKKLTKFKRVYNESRLCLEQWTVPRGPYPRTDGRLLLT